MNSVMPPPEEGGRGVGNDRIVINIRPREILRVILSDFVLFPSLRMTRGWFPVGGVMLRTGSATQSARAVPKHLAALCPYTPPRDSSGHLVGLRSFSVSQNDAGLPSMGSFPHSEPHKGRENPAIRTEVRKSTRSPRFARDEGTAPRDEGECGVMLRTGG